MSDIYIYRTRESECVFVCERERERASEREGAKDDFVDEVTFHDIVLLCLREKERECHQQLEVNYLPRLSPQLISLEY